MSVVDKSERIDAVVYCADTSNEGHLGASRARAGKREDAGRRRPRRRSKPYYLMSSRPGVMNRQQVKALRDAGLVQIGGTRQGLGAIDRVGRYMTRAEAARATSAKRSGRSSPSCSRASPAGARSTSTMSKRLLARISACRSTREHRVATLDEATQGRARARLPGRAQGACRTRSRTRPSSAWSPSVSRTTTSSRARSRGCSERIARARSATVRRRFPGAGIRRRRRRGVRRHLARSRFRPVAGFRHGRHRDRGHARLCAPHAAAARGRRRGDDRRDARRRHAGRIPRPAGGGCRKASPPASTRSPISPSTMPTFIAEVDLNPIKALPEGRGCVVVDALIVAQAANAKDDRAGLSPPAQRRQVVRRQDQCRRRCLDRHRARRIRHVPGTERLRQDHHAADDRRIREPDRAASSSSTDTISRSASPMSAISAWCSRTTPCSRT